MMLTLEEAARATGAQIAGTHSTSAPMSVSTDTRTLQRGQLYVALRGENFDGHAYLDQAVQKGAAAVLVDQAPQAALDVATLIVKDTKAGYMALAAAARNKFPGRVIAITGSTGKTTTKVLLAQLLATTSRGAVYASPANENNEIGVSKLFLSAPPQTQVMVVEMGARHFGDIEALVEVARPHVGILTNVGEAHLEIMGSRERLAATKWALFSQGASAILNVRDEVSRGRASLLWSAARWFGLGPAALPRIQDAERGVFLLDRKKLVVAENGQSATYPMDAHLPGDYNLENLAAALGGALELGCDPAALAGAVKDLRLPDGRYERVQVADRIRVVYDAYNASMSGMMATLDAFKQEPGPRRIAVLGSMAELGAEAAHMHVAVGKHAASCRLEALLVGGEFATQLASGARHGGLDAKRIVEFNSNSDAIAWLKQHTRPDDVILLKGSRKYKMEEILEGLRG